MSRNRLAERKGNYPEFKEGFPEFKSGSQFAEFGLMNQIGAGGGDGLPAWTQLPYWAFDNIKVPLLVDQEVTIYGDTLINVPIENDLTVTYTCVIGAQSGTKDFVINPVAGNIGEYQLTCVFKNKGVTFLTKTITLTVYAKISTSVKKLFMIGDSIMNNGMIYYYPYTLRQTLNNTTFTFLGTQGTTNKHEGRPGWTWNSFITTGSPFYKNGAIDIASYFTDNTIDAPDVVCIQLGVNDVFPSSLISGDGLTDAELTVIIDKAKILVDAFLAYNTAYNIIIEIPTICENTGGGWNANYDESLYSQDKYIEAIHKYSKALIDTFYNGKYNERVDTGYSPIYLDRNEGYPKTNDIHTNGVHPDDSGDVQLGHGLAFDFNRVFLRQILKDGQTAGNYDFTKLVTKDSNNKVTLVEDTLGSGNDLAAGLSVAPELQADGIKFGGNTYLQKAFTYAEPQVLLTVMKLNTWSNLKVIMDGVANGSARLIMNVASPTVYLLGGNYAASNNNIPVGHFAIVRVIADEANSLIKVNDTTATTGDPNGADMGGLTLGANCFKGDNGDVTFKRVIARRSTANIEDLHNLLKAEYNSKDF